MVSGMNQRHVSRQHQHVIKALQRLARCHERVAGAALFALQHKVDSRGLQRLAHQLGLVPNDGEDVLGRNDLAGRCDHMAQQRFARDLVQHFGMARLQPRAFSRGQYRNGELKLALACGVAGVGRRVHHDLTGYQEKLMIRLFAATPGFRGLPASAASRSWAT